MNGYIHWDEPTPSGNHHCTISIEKAIKIQKEVAAARNYTYASDQLALEDFMVAHFAWKDDE